MIITKDNINKFIEGSSMDCSNKGITHIEYIPDGITRLDCYNNKLTELPKLPDSLTNLYCGDNKLTELPKLPESLISLFCYENNLPYEITIDNLKQHNTLIKRKEILEKIKASEYLSPIGAKDYLEQDKFNEITKVKLKFNDFQSMPYVQKKFKSFFFLDYTNHHKLMSISHVHTCLTFSWILFVSFLQTNISVGGIVDHAFFNKFVRARLI